ncbi:alpha-glucosidase C-terminal domain-containing protein [bacterium]|nr:alpha-glucosidase C-terminal domain-containing protein [bacterium]
MNKKILSFCILVSLFLSSNIVCAQNSIISAPVQATKTIFQTNIETEIENLILQIYGEKFAPDVYNKVMELAQKAIQNRSDDLKKEDLTRIDDWYKDEIIYMFYVDQFGVRTPDKPNQFKDSAEMFEYLRDLGVTTLYLLPFADSPMSDAGFDVKNPQNIRKDLGGTIQFKEFIKEAKENGFKIKSDLVLNHFSDQHEWFQELLKGDLTKLNYFIVRNEMPKYKKYVDTQAGTIVEYQEADGRVSKRRLIFPEITENHWRGVNINGADYFFYHTFYPFQLDINWQNPEVLYYCLETINYWTNLGIDIFRLDAVPYLYKEVGTNAENLPKTHAIVKLLSNYIQMTAPRTVIQAEACQWPNDILPYFGKERKVRTLINNEEKNLKRTDEFQIAYHFPYMPAIWASLVTGDKSHFVNAYKNTPIIPQSSTWGVFLRVHDELSLEMVDKETREIVYNALIKKGAEFRKGLGVSGRMANFLDNDPNRIEMAFSILLSMPGIPIIYYGDEVGVRNNFENAKESARARFERSKLAKFKLTSYFDSRDINRGAVPAKLFYGSSKDYYEFNSKVYKKVKNLISLRKRLPSMSRGDFTLLKTKSPSNFAYIRSLDDEKILVINNLSDEKLIAEITIPMSVVLESEGNKITSFKNLVNGDDVKVNISLKNRTMNLRIAPYGVVWLKL